MRESLDGVRGGIGSFFSYPELDSADVAESKRRPPPWPAARWALLNSGRAALLQVLDSRRGSHRHGTLWVPSYYCWEVTQYIQRTWPISVYPCNPTSQCLPSTIPPDDLILVVSYFGMEPPSHSVNPEQVILDVTHDPLAPWIDTYTAGWVVGSLRKTLPLPEGGFAYSSAPPIVVEALHSDESRRAAQRGTEAMTMKARWLADDPKTTKDEWYQALQQHEATFERLAPARMQPENERLLHTFPVESWRTTRLSNLTYLREACLPLAWAQAPLATFGLVLVTDSPELTETVRRQLVGQGVYPARLWPQPAGSSESDRELAARILVIHTDHRYTRENMAHVGQVIQTVRVG